MSFDRAARARAVDAVLDGYSAVLFARSRRLGILLLLATFMVPDVGWMGLVGVVLTLGVAHWLRLLPARPGPLAANALLVFLGLGTLVGPSLPLVPLAIAVAFGTVLVFTAVSTAFSYHLRLPSLSVPFVLVSWGVAALVPLLDVPPPRLAPWFLLSLPAPVDLCLRALGAVFFVPHAAAGLWVLVALAGWSRVSLLHALLGFGIAWAVDGALLQMSPGVFPVFAGFNVVLTTLALGGVFVVPTLRAWPFAVVMGLVTAFVAAALSPVLAPLGLPALAAPFNGVVLFALYALSARTSPGGVLANDGIEGPPEAVLVGYRRTVLRNEGPLAIGLPVRGTWVVTQGWDGPTTHTGPWRHGLDLEVLSPDGAVFRGDGASLIDYTCYRLPVFAPCAGTVTAVVDGVPDSLPGSADTIHNWGNVVVLQVAHQRWLLLAHLSPGSLRVRPGDVVTEGQELARVGSSGRAPRPHLHLQVQNGPEIGAPTCSWSIAGVLEGPGPPTWSSQLLPSTGAWIRQPQAIPGVWPGWMAGQQHAIQVSVAGGPPEARVLMAHLQDDGSHRIVCAGRPGALVVSRTALSWRVRALEGDEPALWALYVGLAFVPHDSAAETAPEGLVVHDALDLVPLGWRDWLGLRTLVSLQLRVRRDGAGWTVHTEGEEVQGEARVGDDGIAWVDVHALGRHVRVEGQGGWR